MGCGSTLDGHRDSRRGDDSVDREEHDDPHAVDADLLHLLRQPACSHHPGVRGGVSHDEGQPSPRQVRPHGNSARATWSPPDRGHAGHRCQRHPQRPPLTSRRTRGTRSRSPTTRAGCPRRTLRGWSTTRRSSRLTMRSRKKELPPRMDLSLTFNMKSTMEDENLNAKISEEEKKTIITKCDEALKWLESNQLGE